MSNGQLILISTLIYGAICVFVGIKGAARVKTSEGFFLASRSFGWFIMVCSVTMGIYSGLAFYGSPAFGFRSGVGTNAATGFYLTGLMYPAIGYKLWRLGKDRNYMTAADFLRDRFYSEGYGVLVALLQVVFIVPYMALQFDAIGKGLSVCSENYISFRAAVVMFAVFVGAYIVFGGAQAIGWLDIFNALLGVLGPIVAVVWIVFSVYDGSIVKMADTLQNVYPNYNTIPGPDGLFTSGNILAYMISGNLALIVAPHILPKFFMAKNKNTFKQMAIVGPLMYAWLGFGIVLITWVGGSLYSGVLPRAESDFLVPKLILQHTPVLINIMMLWALFAFATSTSDAFGLSAATIISRDLIGRFLLRNMKDAQRKDKLSITIGKVCVILLMPLIVLIAFERPTFIVNYAYSFASPGFAQILPAIVLGLYWKQSTREAAWAGTVTGLVVLSVTLFYPPLKWPLKIHPIIWSLGANFLVFWLTAILTKVPAKVASQFHAQSYDGPYSAKTSPVGGND